MDLTRLAKAPLAGKVRKGVKATDVATELAGLRLLPDNLLLPPALLPQSPAD
jgi:hypothetical protein